MAHQTPIQNHPGMEASLEVAQQAAAHEVAEVAGEQVNSEDESMQTPEDSDEATESYHSNVFMKEKNPNQGLLFPVAATDPSLADLREISSLASWTVSSYKPGCGVSALRQPTTSTFWQSDGPQPHLLNIHFFKMVKIVKLRVYLDFELDESYTPTRLSFCAGTHEYDAIEFAEWRWHDAGPRGWVDVDLSDCGSAEEHQRLAEQYAATASADTANGDNRDDNNPEDALRGKGVLTCFFLQLRVLENHQNGKDTHIRGVQIFARDDRVRKRHNEPFAAPGTADARIEELRQGLEEADWMREPEIR